MKNKALICCALLLAGSLFAACGTGTDSTSTPKGSTPVETPQSSSAVGENSAVEEVSTGPETLEQAVRRLLEGYHNGTYPEPMVFETDYLGPQPLPPGIQPPPADTTDYTTEAVYSEKDGDTTVVHIPLGDEYELEATLIYGDGSYGYLHVQAKDLRPAVEASAFRQEGLELGNYTCDRLSVYAEVESLKLADGTLAGGNATWSEPYEMLWIGLYGEDETTSLWMACTFPTKGPMEILYVEDFGDAFGGENIKENAALALYEGLLAAREAVMK